MTHRRRTTASALALALAAAVLAPTIVIASAQARETAPEAIDRAAAAEDPVTHTVYVARPTDVGTFSVSDDDVLAALGEVKKYWTGEAEGRIEDFVLPTGPNTARFKTFETDVSADLVCGFRDFDALAAEAKAQFSGIGFDPFEGDTNISWS